VSWGKIRPEWDSGKICFNELKESNLALIHKWVNFKEVARWVKWDDKGYPSLEFVQKHWMPRIRGSDPTKCYMVSYEGIKIAFIQSSLIDDELRYAEALNLGFNATSIDIFIGEEGYIHRSR
jgi:aminoglycoside 6'-N-acetyltransferase